MKDVKDGSTQPLYPGLKLGFNGLLTTTTSTNSGSTPANGTAMNNKQAVNNFLTTPELGVPSLMMNPAADKNPSPVDDAGNRLRGRTAGRSTAQGENEEVANLKDEVAALRAELRGMRGASSSAAGGSGVTSSLMKKADPRAPKPDPP